MNLDRRAVALLLALLAALALPLRAEAAVVARDRILAAGAGEHLWWIELDPKESRLLHGFTGNDAFLSHVAATYLEPPEALAAYGDRAWLAFGPPLGPDAAGAASLRRRDVVRLAIRRNPATSLFYVVPPSGAELLPSLPADGDLVGFEADASGLWALLLPPPAARYGVRREGASAGQPAAGPSLRFLEGNEWVEVPLPSDFQAVPAAELVRLGEALAVVAPSREGSRLALRDGAGWRTFEVDLPFAGTRFLTAGGRPAAATVAEPDLIYSYLRDGRSVPWASMLAPNPPFALLGDDHGGVVIARRDNVMQAWRLDPLATLARKPVPFEPTQSSAGAWVHLPMVAVLVLASLLAVLFVRELARADGKQGGKDGQGEELEPSVPALAFDRRIVALLIDLVPGGIVAVVVLGASPLDLLRVPSFALERTEASASMLMILLTCLVGAASEGFFGATVGKWVVGGVVTAPDGSPLRLRAALVRNLCKILVLAAPILGLVAWWSVGHRGVHDILSRSVVADRRSDRTT